MSDTDNSAVTVDSLFVRERNVLLSRADLAPLFSYWQAHCAAHQVELDEATAARFRSALAAFTMHCASRPRNEHLSWTISFQRPLLNLFLVGDTNESTVAGRAFTEGVKQAPHQSFYQEFVPRGKDAIRSFVPFTGDDPLLAAEQYYAASEQRPARFFQLSETRFAILSAHPDWDQEWFHQVSLGEIRDIDSTEALNLIEQRRYRWHCGCSHERLLEVLRPMFREDLDGLFQGDEQLEARCPRCQARYLITREAAEASLVEPAPAATPNA